MIKLELKKDWIIAKYPKGHKLESRQVNISMMKKEPKLFLKFANSIVKANLALVQ